MTSKISMRIPAVLRLALLAAMVSTALPLLSQSPTNNGTQHRPIHIVPMRNPHQHQLEQIFRTDSGTVANGPSGALLKYYGGPVISNVNVVVVYWTASVDATTKSNIVGFFSTIATSKYMDMLNEYSTAGATNYGSSGGTNQTIGQGNSTVTAYTITPAYTSHTMDDTNIQTELAAQIDAGKLPLPTYDAGGNTNTLYMVYFPSGYTITDSGQTSCVDFCAYHGTGTYNSKNLLYGVLPDIGPSSACYSGCGANASWFNNLTSVSSHEWSEAITDAGVGLAATYDPPLAWYDITNGENGDICNADQATGTNSGGYTVQLTWSNIQGKCADGPAYFVVSAGGTQSSGQSFSATVQAFNTAGGGLTYTRNVHWSSSDPTAVLPADGPFSSSPYSITLNTLGTQTITLSDALATSVTGSATISVGTGTSTTMTATPDPTTQGSTVTLTATVRVQNSDTVPTGQVQFQDNGVNLGSPVTLVSGNASTTTNTLTVGTHNLTAIYSGLYSGSTSAVFPEQITDSGATANTVTVTATPTTSTDNANVMFTATMNPTAATGTVLFVATAGSNIVNLGSATISGGVASVNTTALKPGVWTITGYYSGDSTYAPTSGTLQHTRQRKSNFVRSTED